nr:MAG TPA: hypothetical protein [Caudoviricetes sp.]
MVGRFIPLANNRNNLNPARAGAHSRLLSCPPLSTTRPPCTSNLSFSPWY